MFLDKKENIKTNVADDEGVKFYTEAYEDLSIGETHLTIELETEKFYSNLNTSMIFAEHTAIVNEDAELLNEAAKDFFQTILDWLRKLGAQVKAFFIKLGKNIVKLAKNAKDVLKDLPKAARTVKFNLTSGVYTKVADGSFEIPSIKSTDPTSFDSEKIDVKGVLKELGLDKLEKPGDIGKMMLGELKKGTEINGSVVKNAVKILQNADTYEKEVKKTEEAVGKVLAASIKVAEQGVKNAGKDKDETAKSKLVLDNAKLFTSVYNTLSAGTAKAVASALGNATLVLNAAKKASKKKDAKKDDKKDDKKDAKKESGVLSQFGFKA